MKKRNINKTIRLASSIMLMCAISFPCTSYVLQAQVSITWYPLEQAQKLAKVNNKKVFIYAEARWCTYCQKMNKQVFPQQKVIDSLTTYFYSVRIDIESRQPMIFNGNKTTQFQFSRDKGVRATPTFFFVDSGGKIIGAQPGFIPADTFSRLIGYIGSDAYKKMEFGSYLKKHTDVDSGQGNHQ